MAKNNARLEKLRALMEDAKLDNVLLADPTDVFYYGGYMPARDDRALLVVKRASASLFVSPLNSSAKGSPGVETKFIDRKKFALPLKAGRTGFDEGAVSARLYMLLKKSGAKMVPFADKVKEPRMVKEQAEIEAIRKSAAVTKRVMEELAPLGRTEQQVAAEIKLKFLAAGCCEAFEAIVSSGPASAIVHSTPGARKIGPMDLTIIDMGAKTGPYCSDMTRTFCGRPSPKQYALIEDMAEIQGLLMDKAVAGVKLKEMTELYEGLMKKKGYKVAHSFGHGIGLSVHEPVGDVLLAGTVITVEPGAYVRGLGGSRKEDVILVKNGKCSVL